MRLRSAAAFALLCSLPSLALPAFAEEARPSLSQPALSPDGKEIAFVSGGDIWTVAAAGGEAHLLISDPAEESRPLYSPDGTKLAFMSTRTGGGDIYVLTFATGRLQRILTPGHTTGPGCTLLREQRTSAGRATSSVFGLPEARRRRYRTSAT